MDISINNDGKTAQISVQTNEKEWSDALTQAYNATKGKYNIPGFRKGRAPKGLIERHYGDTVFVDEALNICVSNGYKQALKENPDIYPVSEPEISIESFDGKSLKFLAKVTLFPVLSLGEYKGIKLPKVEYNVKDSDVEDEIERARKNASRTISADRPAIEGDTVNINYKGFLGETQFEGGTADNHDLVLGSNSFIPGFESQLIGAAKGEEREVNVKFPDDYHAEDLKGKDVVFKVKVNDVKYTEIPELDDALVCDISTCKTVDEYREYVKKRLLDAAKNRERQEKTDLALKAITDNATVDIPDCMVDEQLERMIHDLEQRLAQYAPGMRVEDYLKYNNMSLEDYKKDRRDEAQMQVKTKLAVEKLIETESLGVTDEDLEAHIEKAAQSMGKSAAEYKKMLKGESLTYIKNDLLLDKLFDYITSVNEYVLDKEQEADTKEQKPKAAPRKKTAAAKDKE